LTDSGIITRAARIDDSTSIAAIFDDTWPVSTLSMSDEVRSKPGRFFVAEAHGGIVGFIEFSVWHNWPAIRSMQDRDPDAGDALLLDWLAVNRSRRGQGFGRRLLDAWLAQLPREILYVIANPILADSADDRAGELRLRRFYTGSGFQLLPDPHHESNSYLLGWARSGAPLPVPPPWPEPEPRQEHPPRPPRDKAKIEEIRQRLLGGTGDRPKPE
jgi:GNAT superfamily N-acetyltransferase